MENKWRTEAIEFQLLCWIMICTLTWYYYEQLFVALRNEVFAMKYAIRTNTTTIISIPCLINIPITMKRIIRLTCKLQAKQNCIFKISKVLFIAYQRGTRGPYIYLLTCFTLEAIFDLLKPR